MGNYIGLDVSLKRTSICIMNESEKILHEMSVVTDPDAIMKAISETKLTVKKAAIECGGTSHWLVKSLKDRGLEVICIDARKMAAAITIRGNKTDKNDAQEIANALRTGYYKEVYQKQDDVVEKMTLLTTRRTLITQRVQISNCIIGMLRAFGIFSCGSSTNEQKFIQNVQQALKGLNDDIRLSIDSLLASFKCILEQIAKIDRRIETITETDEDVQLLKTIPGVGAVTALVFKLEVDNPARFKKSRSVGAYVGMASREYSSGESQKQGSISKAGSAELRMLLCQSAMCLMYNSRSMNRIKLFGLKIKKRKGHGKAVVAVGRKLAVTMHCMLITRKPFDPGSIPDKEIKKIEAANTRRKIKDPKKVTKVKLPTQMK